MEFWVEDTGLDVTSWRNGTPESSSLYDRSYLEKKDKYSAFLGGNQPLCVIRNENIKDGGKLLLIRDSYADSLAPFLTQSFHNVYALDYRKFRESSVAEMVEKYDIDYVIVMPYITAIQDSQGPGMLRKVCLGRWQ